MGTVFDETTLVLKLRMRVLKLHNRLVRTVRESSLFGALNIVIDTGPDPFSRGPLETRHVAKGRKGPPDKEPVRAPDWCTRTTWRRKDLYKDPKHF